VAKAPWLPQNNFELGQSNSVLPQNNLELSQNLFELSQNKSVLSPGRAVKGRALWAADGRMSRVIRAKNAPSLMVC
jgi:hypothetical protein